MKEIWKDVVGYEGFYQVSNLGRVKSLIDCNGKYRELILKPNKNPLKYEIVTLSVNGVSKRKSLHRVVAEAFIPNPNNLPFINHKDEVPFNNRVDNLEWCNQSYNVNYGNRNKKVINSLINNSRKTRPRPVIRIDANGNRKKYESIHSAARDVGGNIGGIWEAASGRIKHSRGYKWEFLDSERF